MSLAWLISGLHQHDLYHNEQLRQQPLRIGHIHGHPASHRKMSLNQAHKSPSDRQDLDMLQGWSEHPVLLHGGLNWAGGNAALTGVYLCGGECVWVCCRIDLLKDKLLSTH